MSREEALNSRWGSSCDVLIHLEVKQHVQKPSSTDICEFEYVNVGGTKSWLEWTERNVVRRFVFFSSIKAASPAPRCQNEEDECAPDTPYGRSKLQAERAVIEWANADSKRSALILRPAVVYGPGNQANMLSLLDAIYRNRYFLVGDNGNVKSIISLKNLTAAVCHLLTLDLPGVHTFYLTDRESFTVAQIAAMIRQILNDDRPFRKLPLPLARMAARAGDAFVRLTGRNFPLTTTRLEALTETTRFSCAKLLQTGFVHPQSTREGLEEMVNWYLSTRTSQ